MSVDSVRVADGSRESVEEVLRRTWEDLLDVDFDSGDDFFDLGGYSFLALQMVNGLREHGLHLTVTDVFENRTFAELVDFLVGGRPSGPAGEPSFASLWAGAVSPWSGQRPAAAVQLAAGEREPFFWVHWGTGNIGYLRPLADRIRAGRPLYGFQHPALVRRERVQTSIGELAEGYLAELLEIQPTGPYLLGGLCNGGMIALEMARRLAATGRQVAFTAFVNTIPSTVPSDLSPGDGLEDLYRLRIAYLKERFGVANLVESAPEVLRKLQEPDVAYYDDHEDPADLLWFQAVWAAIAFAQARNEPRPFEGRAVVFQTKTGEPHFEPHWKALLPNAQAETFDVRSTLPILMHEPFQESITRHLSQDF